MARGSFILHNFRRPFHLLRRRSDGAADFRAGASGSSPMYRRFFTSQIKMAGSGGRLLHFRQFLSTHSTIKGKKCWLELLPIFVQQCRVALTIQSFTKQFIENKISVCLAGASNS